jgi:hypothetical protein
MYSIVPFQIITVRCPFDINCKGQSTVIFYLLMNYVANLIV